MIQCRKRWFIYRGLLRFDQTSQAANTVFLELLKRFMVQGRNASPNATAYNYAPTMFRTKTRPRNRGLRVPTFRQQRGGYLQPKTISEKVGICHRPVALRNRIQVRTLKAPMPSNLDIYLVHETCSRVYLVDLHPFFIRCEGRRHLWQFSADLAGRLLDYSRTRHCRMRVTKCGEYSFLLNQ